MRIATSHPRLTLSLSFRAAAAKNQGSFFFPSPEEDLCITGSPFFPSPVGRGFKERDLVQRAFFARDSGFCFCSEGARRLRKDFLIEKGCEEPRPI